MSIDGWYYLHENGDLIYRRDLDGAVADIRESDFAIDMWSFDTGDRAGVWSLLVEASSTALYRLSTKQSTRAFSRTKIRVKHLADKWGCTDQDADTYVGLVGAVLELDGNDWCAHRHDFVNLQESPAGFGETKLEAMSHLCNELGYRPQKMWGRTFSSLLSG